MASNDLSIEAAPDGAVLDTSTDLVAELEAHQAELADAQAAQPKAAKKPSVPAKDTVTVTNTIYEDRTNAPSEDAPVEYELKSTTFPDGTTVVDVGEAISH